MLSPEDAGGVLGAGWWLELLRGVPLGGSLAVLDCGGHAGVAVEALRAGVAAVTVDAGLPNAAALGRFAEACGAQLLPRPACIHDIAALRPPYLAGAALSRA